jgi:hypothetical protein
MGAWGFEPWENDEAVDWFDWFFGDLDVNARIRQAFDGENNHDEVRAACFLLGTLGRTYVWPGDLDELKGLLDEGIARLQRMIDPDGPDHYYLESWGAPDELEKSVKAQIRELWARRARFAQFET